MLRLSVVLVLFVVAAPASAQVQAEPSAKGVVKPGAAIQKAAPAQPPMQLPSALGARKGVKSIPPAAPIETSVARRAAPEIMALVDAHARNHGVPSALAHQIVMKESRYNPAARNRAYWGLMQLRHDTARSVGYGGAASGLLDPDVNLRYGMAYLGNAYRVAGGDSGRALTLYTKGFYFEAKRKGMLSQMRKGDSVTLPASP